MGSWRHQCGQVAAEKIHATGVRALVADLAVTFFTLLIWAGVGIGIMTWIGINLGTNAVGEKLSTLELNWETFPSISCAWAL